MSKKLLHVVFLLVILIIIIIISYFNLSKKNSYSASVYIYVNNLTEANIKLENIFTTEKWNILDRYYSKDNRSEWNLVVSTHKIAELSAVLQETASDGIIYGEKTLLGGLVLDPKDYKNVKVKLQVIDVSLLNK